jgi:F0F1-type ATP synthase alpha subunit
MEIRAEEITRILREQLKGFTTSVDVTEVGTVLSVGDGIARITAWPASFSRCLTASWASRRTSRRIR